MIVAGLQHADDIPDLIDSLNAGFDPSQWPKISKLKFDGEFLELHLHIASDLKWFEGHFPDNPVLPGVVQVHWAVSLAKKLLMDDRSFNQVENLKFKSVVLPGMDLVLRYSGAQAGEKVRFCFLASASDEVHSEGRLSFA